jgi:hypothetical protein
VPSNSGRQSTKPPDILGAGDLLTAVRNRSGSLRTRFVDDPLGLAERFGLKFPEKPVLIMQRAGVYDPERHGAITPGLRDLILDVCTGLVTSAVAVANRGGGKSQGVSFIEFFLVFVRDFDALNLGGSELQAQGVYNYILSYIEHSAEFRDMVRGTPMMSETHTRKNAWIRVLTASQKSVRSPHAGGRKRDGRVAGGLLVIDEEAEASPEIVSAAMFTINTANPSVNVRASTFHNAEGSFREVIDNALDMGYKVYKWDIFDVAERCNCVGGCQSEEKCFREDHYEDYVDPVTGASERRMLHRAYCGGRAMYADGWIPVREIINMWRRIRRNHAVWEVEAMGSRPTASGYVIKDLTKFDTNITDKAGAQLYVPGYPITITVDWGVRACGLEVWQHQENDHHVLVYSEQVEEAGLSQIISIILQLKERYLGEFKEVAADIGGGGNYLNPKLREDHRIPVRDVNFAELKEAAVAAFNIYSESGSIVIPQEHKEFIHQAHNWKRDSANRIVKGNDHMMDSAVCYFAEFIERLGLTNVHVPPRGLKTAAGSFEESGSMVATPRVASGRVAAIRSLNRSPKR